MGTVIGIDVRDPDVPETAVEAAVAWLTDVDARFSPYRAASEISRLARGEIGADDCAPDVRFVLTRCEALRLESDGFFDIRGAGLIGGGAVAGTIIGALLGLAGTVLLFAGNSLSGFAPGQVPGLAAAFVAAFVWAAYSVMSRKLKAVPTDANVLSTTRMLARQSRMASSFSTGLQRMLSGTTTAPAHAVAR